MITRDIQGQVEDLYGVAISPELVSRITDEVRTWQLRPLDAVYPILSHPVCEDTWQRLHTEQGGLSGPGR